MRASEKRFRALVQHASDAIVVIDADGTIRYQSPSVERLLGYPPAELDGADGFALVHPDDLPEVQRRLAEILATPGATACVEVRVRHRDGSWPWVEVVGTNLLHEPDVAGIVANFRDITERRRAEQALRESEERYRTLFDAAPIGIVHVNEGRVVQANSAFQQLLGYTEDELRRMDVREFMAPDDVEGSMGLVGELLAGRRDRYQREGRYARKDGRLIWVSVTVSALRDGDRGRQTVSMVEDITERKRAEQEVQLLHALTRAIGEAENLRAALAVTLFAACEAMGWTLGQAWTPRADGTALECNPAWYGNAEGLAPFRAASERLTFAPGIGPPGRAWSARQPVWLRDAPREADSRRARSAEAAGLKAGLALPVLAGDDVVAVLEFFVRERREEDERLVGTVSAIATQLGSVMQRKRAEEALARHAATLRAQAELLDLAHDAILVLDLQTNAIRFWNQGAEGLYGWRQDEAVGSICCTLLQAELPQPLEQMRAEVLRTGRWEGEVVHTRREGTRLVVASRWALQRDEQGRPAAILEIDRDITERKRAEEALRAQAELLDLAHDAIMVFEVHSGAIVYWNRGAEELYGWTRDEALGQTPLALLHTRFPQPLEEIRAETLRTGRWEGELVHTRRDGSELVVASRWAPRRDERGEPVAILAINTDITARRRAEEEVRRREASLAAAQRIAHLGSWEWDVATDELGWSDETFRLFGFPPRSFTPTFEASLQAVHPEDRERVRAAVQDALAGRPFQLDLRLARPSGEERIVEAQGEAIFGDAGQPVRIVGTMRDITERKRADEELQRAKEAAEAANRAKSEFLANMSHEIRTPMNGVIGMTELLLSTELTPEQREYAEAVNSSGETLLRIIDDILDVSRLEAGKLGLESFDFHLRTTVEDVAGLFAVQAHAKGLELIAFTEPTVPTALVGDPFRLRQVLTNLLGNAIKFTERGEVGLRVSLVERSAEGVTLRFAISDTGIGLTAAERERLFQPFSQADPSTTRRYGGSGLGLAISKQLVALMGGEIGVESEPGRGSTFWFTARFARQAGAPTTGNLRRTDLRGLRVLIVDDNATNRAILHQQVLAWGVRDGSAEDGPGALALLRAAAKRGEPYDVVILDRQLPGMDGLALAGAIKADPALAATRLVLLTSAGQRSAGDEAAALGIVASLTKPVRQSELYDCLTTVTGTLPSAAEKPKRRVLPTRRAAVPASAHRILLAEDNIVNQRVAQQMLQQLGYQVDTAANGREAMAALARGDYAAVLMDCQMPEMDGYEATAAIRRREGGNPKTRHIPIIAMTANALEGDRERCLAAGMDDYVAKPITTEKLDALLQRWAPRDGSPASGSAGVGSGAAVPDGGDESIDQTVLAGLRGLQQPGAPDLLSQLIELFLDDAAPRLATLAQALAQGDAQALARQAHILKGSSANLGARQMARLCEDLEALGRSGELRRAPEVLAQLEAEFDRVRAALRAEVP